jgi:lysozyme
MAFSRANAEAALQDARVLAFLDMISAAEGADYNTQFGGSRIASLASHPNKVVTVGSLKSTAAGRYQFLIGTWREAANALQLPDFQSHSQDLAAVYLMNKRGALKALLQNDFAGAVAAAGKEWASLPGSPYGQRTRSLAFVTNAYNSALGNSGNTTVVPTTADGTEPTQASNVGAPSLLVLAGVGVGVFGLAWWLGKD